MWDDFHYFVSAAECGSFSRAAKQRGISVATISRRVEALELSLKLKLFNRQVSGVQLTTEGRIIYETASSAIDKMAEVERLAVSLSEGVDLEPVVISSTEPVVAEILAPNLPQFWRENPNIKLRLSVDTANVSLFRRQADLSIRLARPTQDNVVIKRLPDIKQGLYASAGYLQGRDPSALQFSQETFLGMDKSFGDIPETMWFVRQGLSQQQQLQSSSVRTLCQAALHHCGIALLPDFIARRAGLIEVAAEQLPVRSPYLLFHRDYRHIKRIQKVRHWIVSCFESVLQN